MEVLVLKSDGGNYSVSLSQDIFDVKYNDLFLHQFVTSYISNSHEGQKSQKSRGEVSGSGKKPWRQKGSGRARVGSIRSPLWRGGGKIFAYNSDINRKKKINKRFYSFCMKMLFSQLLRENRIFIFEKFDLANISTKLFLNKILYLNANSKSLFIFDDLYKNIILSSRNLKDICVISCRTLNPLMLMKFNNFFITVESIRFFEEIFNEKTK
ncbi:MAG TPA: 50S ribosomal protein L4 [Candidatus Azoamicus sp.]